VWALGAALSLTPSGRPKKKASVPMSNRARHDNQKASILINRIVRLLSDNPDIPPISPRLSNLTSRVMLSSDSNSRGPKRGGRRAAGRRCR